MKCKDTDDARSKISSANRCQESDSDSDVPPPTPSRRRKSVAKTHEILSSKNSPDIIAKTSSNSASTRNTSTPKVMEVSSTTVENYGVIPSTGQLDCATQEALQVYFVNLKQDVQYFVH